MMCPHSWNLHYLLTFSIISVILYRHLVINKSSHDYCISHGMTHTCVSTLIYMLSNIVLSNIVFKELSINALIVCVSLIYLLSTGIAIYEKTFKEFIKHAHKIIGMLCLYVIFIKMIE